MRQIELLILLLTSLTSSRQSTYPTTKELKQIFKESEEKYGLTNLWIACNDDSSYFKSDTVRLFNHVNYYYHSNGCCKFIKWEFQKSLTITFTESRMCVEPPRATLFGLQKIKMTDDKGVIYLELSSSGHRIDKFKVVGLSTKELWTGGHVSNVLTLKRERK